MAKSTKTRSTRELRNITEQPDGHGMRRHAEGARYFLLDRRLFLLAWPTARRPPKRCGSPSRLGRSVSLWDSRLIQALLIGLECEGDICRPVGGRVMVINTAMALVMT